MPAPFRSVRTIRLQPDVSSCWAIVAYFWVSFSAFWMRILNPACSNCLVSVGWSLCTQRLELSASGMIAHPVLGFLLAFLFPLEPLLAEPLLLSLLPQPAKANAPAAASAAIAPNLDMLIWDLSSSGSRCTFEMTSQVFRGPHRTEAPEVCQD